MKNPKHIQQLSLLESACELVAKVGVAGLRTRDIARNAGVSVGTLHYCFETKEALLHALYGYLLERARDEIEHLLEAGSHRADCVHARIVVRLRVLSSNSTAIKAWRAFTGAAWTDETIRAIYVQHLAEQRSIYEAIVAAGRADGSFPGLPNVSDKMAAALVFGLYEGVRTQWLMDPSAFTINEYADAMFEWMTGAGALSEKDDKNGEKDGIG
ncbi:MAG: TetR/AcrR family transcriptional regulator [Capsulimonadaceae bacterium]|nr:TetR/AcrR family transcriptional regulator [Capsulimonadaceae bacterium]